jgi:hypothetical protein
MPTIASSSICLSMGEGEKLTVEKYSSQIVGSKKNYLLEELMRKLDCLEGEGASLQKHFSKVKDVFEDIMVSAKEVAGKMWSSEVELDLVETGPRSTLVQTGPRSSFAVVGSHRRSQMEVFRKKFGQHGEPYRVGEYKLFNMYFDSGKHEFARICPQ